MFAQPSDKAKQFASSDLKNIIPWSEFKPDTSFYVPYSELRDMGPKDKTLNHLRVLASRRGHNLGLVFKIIDHPENGTIEVFCKNTKEPKLANNVGRPSKKGHVKETAEQSYDRAKLAISARMGDRPPMESRESYVYDLKYEVDVAALANEYQVAIGNPPYYKVDMIREYRINKLAEFDANGGKPVSWNTEATVVNPWSNTAVDFVDKSINNEEE